MSTSNMPVIDPEVFKTYCVWGTILALKLLAMFLLTARQRFTKQIFICEEDAKYVKKAKVVYDDPDIERVRRAHLNDLENIPVWYIVTLLWLTTGPSTWLASMLIRTFVICRILHTIIYVFIQKQPHRAIVFFIGVGITLYQAISTLLYYL